MVVVRPPATARTRARGFLNMIRSHRMLVALCRPAVHLPLIVVTSLSAIAAPIQAQQIPADTVRVDTTDVFRKVIMLDPVVVRGDRSYSAASSTTVRGIDLAIRPRASSQDLLRLAPGLVISQHAGGGKAEQIFLRGFDADHGTDVAISVDGTPVNMVSHAHGQGYADLHFVIPEVVEAVEVNKGPFSATDGDFATAGSVMLRTRDRISGAVMQARGGSFGTGNLLMMLPFGGAAHESGGFVAASADRSDGPFEASQNFRRYNLFSKWTRPLGNADLIATVSGFRADWDASGQIPGRAVQVGTITRFGAIDPTEGGDTRRYDASLEYRSRPDASQQWSVRAWAAHYYLDLFSNFTFLLNDSINGDGIEQVDDRYLGGFQARYGRAAGMLGRNGWASAGTGARIDRIDAMLASQRERSRLAVRTDDRIDQRHGFAWARYDLQLASRVRIDFGMRADAFQFDVRDRLNEDTNELPRGTGIVSQAIISPKVNLAWDATDQVTVFANAASGFHSNHARDAILASGGERVLPRARGSEVGARHTWSGGSIAVAAWLLDLQSELIYVGDEGVTEPVGRTRRTGLDIEGRVQLLDWLWLDADLNLNRARLRDEDDGEDYVPLAPRLTSNAGLTVRELGRVSGGARVRHIGSRPADESGSVTAQGSTIAEVFARFAATSRANIFFAIDNLFDARWNEAQFSTTSRLPGEPAAGITELHFTPGAPRSVQIGLEYRF